jgi:hypothetical protein
MCSSHHAKGKELLQIDLSTYVAPYGNMEIEPVEF